MNNYKITYRFKTSKWYEGSKIVKANSIEDAKKKADIHESLIVSCELIKI